jgi:DNA-binding response OmpR family regulator
MVQAFAINSPQFKRLGMLADVGHIIVVDDDSTLRQMVIAYLEEHNVSTRAASNRVELRRLLDGTQPSLILLDLRLGQDDGLDLLREIRSHSDVPVIIATGHRPDEIDRIVGLELGADDYIVKPFSLRELLARACAPCCDVRRWGGPRASVIRNVADIASTAGPSNVAVASS